MTTTDLEAYHAAETSPPNAARREWVVEPIKRAVRSEVTRQLLTARSLALDALATTTNPFARRHLAAAIQSQNKALALIARQQQKETPLMPSTSTEYNAETQRWETMTRPRDEQRDRILTTYGRCTVALADARSLGSQFVGGSQVSPFSGSFQLTGPPPMSAEAGSGLVTWPASATLSAALAGLAASNGLVFVSLR